MGLPAAKEGDLIEAIDTLIVLVPAPDGENPVPMEFPYNGPLSGDLSADVMINGRPAAMVGSTAENTPPFFTPIGTFAIPPDNTGIVMTGSPTVFINGRPAARMGDTALTWNNPVPLDNGFITVEGDPDVLIGE